MESAKRNLNILPVDESESDKPPPLVLESGRKANSDYSRASFLSSVRAWFKSRTGAKNDASLKETIEEIIEEHNGEAEDRLEPEERVMLHNVLNLGDTRVNDIMVPRTDISAVPVDITLMELKAHILEQQHTRIPVYDETLDKVLGFIHVKDLMPMLGGEKEYNLRQVVRDILFVPPSMKIMDLLLKMRNAGSHMAIVVDEYGGTDGLVTMENLFEEIVGDIQDEHDDEEDEDKITRVTPNIFEVNARIRIEKLEKELGLDLVSEEKENEFDTLGGLIFFQLGRVPARGESVRHISGVRFEILEADPRSIKKVRIVNASSNV
ncbi:MAG: hemolysin family protein [Rickettsiales bacterium]